MVGRRGVTCRRLELPSAIGGTWEAWPATRRSPTNEPLALRRKPGQGPFTRPNVAGCHGKYGNGRITADSAQLDPISTRPLPFSQSAAARFHDKRPFKSRTTPSGALPTDEDIFPHHFARWCARVRSCPPGAMAADGHIIPEQDRWDLVDYVKTFSPRFKSEPVPEPIQIPTPPYPRSEGSPGLGHSRRPHGSTARCSVGPCHGNAGRGDGPSSNELVDDWESPIPALRLHQRRIQVRAIRRPTCSATFNTGLNGTPMPSFYDTILYPARGVSRSQRVEDGW